MTITEAKKIIEMCADAVKKGDGEEAKIYVNKEYVMSILDMVDDYKVQPGIDPITTPVWPPTWPQVWYKDGTAPEKEKAPWWWDERGFTCGPNSTGSKPSDADIVVTSGSSPADEIQRFRENNTKPVDVSPKRTDYIDDWAGGSTTAGPSYSETK